MKQLTLAAVGFERYAKTTRRAAFLAEMERVVPWSALCALIEPFYPKPGKIRWSARFANSVFGSRSWRNPTARSLMGISRLKPPANSG
jgi:hypothetical protein